MADRRHSTTYSPAVQWNGHQPYPAANIYASSNYPSSTGHHSSTTQYTPAYNQEAQAMEISYGTNYYAGGASYSPPSSPLANRQVYSPALRTSLDEQPGYSIHQSIPRSQSTHPSPHPYSHSHSQRQSQVTSAHSQPRARSNSQAQLYISSHAEHGPAPSNYSSPAPLSQTVNISSQYPASPTRPFSCDLCALSFNRQHDLKRHRETHTGDKPYLCNGGCGKTFTRKDALKRHQLVKGCGKVDDAWP